MTVPSHCRALFAGACLALLLLLTTGLPAQAQPTAGSGPGSAVVLTPTLITLGPRDRAATVILSNDTAQPQSYRISIRDMRMSENGELQIGSPGSFGAADWVIVSPARTTLEPGKSQQIRILVRRPANLAEGQYRTHLSVAQEPSASDLQETDTPSQGLSFTVNVVFETTLPILINQGTVSSTPAVVSAQRRPNNQLSLTVSRSGNAEFRGFAVVRDGRGQSENLPVTIYREANQVTRRYDLRELSASGPLSIELRRDNNGRPGDTVLATGSAN